ncbi:MAG: hypothetical protein ACI4JA_07880 [Oscillospiraceae bacterium]
MKTKFFGGYDKMQCLTVIDMLNNRIFQLETAKAAKSKGEPYNVPPEPVLPKINTVMMGGFDQTDIDAFLSDLKNKCRELENELMGF